MFEFLKATENSELEQDIIEKETFSIARVLNKHTATKSRSERYTHIRPSSIYKIEPQDFIIGYFLGRKRQEEEFKSRLRMDFGTLAHKVIQDLLYGAGYLEGEGDQYVEQVVHCRELGIVGHLDGIIKSKGLFPVKRKAKPRLHLEIKTTNDRNYRLTNKVGDIWPEYLWQAELYQHCTGIDETLFLFLNSETYSYKCLLYRHVPDCRKMVFDKINLIWDYISRRELPVYEKFTKKEWRDAIRDVTVPTSPREIDYRMAKATKKDVEDMFQAAWEGPELVREHRFHPDRKWRFDFAILDLKIAIEIDGFGRHHTIGGFSKDCEKLNAATKLGWRVLRYPAGQVRDCPQCVVDDVGELL